MTSTLPTAQAQHAQVPPRDLRQLGGLLGPAQVLRHQRAIPLRRTGTSSLSLPQADRADVREHTQVSHPSTTPTAIQLKIVTEESVDYDSEETHRKRDEDEKRSMV